MAADWWMVASVTSRRSTRAFSLAKLVSSVTGAWARVVKLETFMSGGVVSGTLRIPIIEDLLGFDWREMFQVGDDIVIAPGTPEEETRRLTAHGSLILDRPLTFSHDMGTQIISLGTTNHDFDADGLSDEREIQLGTNALVPDTDGDGVDDGTEVRLGTDPLVPNQAPSGDASPLTIERLLNRQLELRWLPAPGRSLERSTTMESGTWLTVPNQDEGRLVIDASEQDAFFRLQEE